MAIRIFVSVLLLACIFICSGVPSCGRWAKKSLRIAGWLTVLDLAGLTIYMLLGVWL